MALSKSKSGNSGSSLSSSRQGISTCLIDRDTIMDADLSASEDVRLDGTMTGNLTCAKKLVIGQSGVLNGHIVADEAVILGQVEGELEIRQTLHLKPSAKVVGQVRYGQIIVDSGAVLIGGSQQVGK